MSLLVDYFYDKESAINKSWLCFVNTTTCLFISLQQFHRQWQYAGLMEGSILITISLLTIPCNILAIYNYSRKQMNKELLVLIYALCCYNFLTVPINITNGLARMLDNFPMGHFGCFISCPFALSVNNSTTLTLALISYERRLVLTRRMDDPQMGSGLVKILFLLALINIYTLTIFSLAFGLYFGMVTIIPALVNGPDRPPVDNCLPKHDDFLIIWEILISISHFILPLSVTAYNYCHIWLNSRNFNNHQNHAYYQSQRINSFFARLMMGSLFEFIICQLPFNTAMLVALTERKSGQLHLQSSAIFVSFIFIYFDSMINPFWFSFITLNNRRAESPCISTKIDSSLAKRSTIGIEKQNNELIH